jgi:hypothetical protein
MADLDALRTFAREAGFVAQSCSSCQTPRGPEGCPDCGGSGRLWRSGAAVLSDAGLLRFRVAREATVEP